MSDEKIRQSGEHSTGGLTLPRRWSLGAVFVLLGLVATGATWAAVTEGRVTSNQDKAKKNEAKIEALAETVAKTQLGVCLLCAAQLGPDACKETCKR